jgi:hypothetical protein
MKKRILEVILIFILVFAISCSKTDTTKPFFEIISPLENDTFSLADTIMFQATFHDNEALGQYRIEMKNNFTTYPDSIYGWNLIIVNQLNGKEETAEQPITIPDTISVGNYFCILKAIDASGNEASADTTKIIIQ